MKILHIAYAALAAVVQVQAAGQLNIVNYGPITTKDTNGNIHTVTQLDILRTTLNGTPISSLLRELHDDPQQFTLNYANDRNVQDLIVALADGVRGNLSTQVWDQRHNGSYKGASAIAFWYNGVELYVRLKDQSCNDVVNYAQGLGR